MNTMIYSVSAKHLIDQAEQVERFASESLQAWILLGKTEKYSEEMRLAKNLRVAAEQKSVSLRREMLENFGFTVVAK